MSFESEQDRELRRLKYANYECQQENESLQASIGRIREDMRESYWSYEDIAEVVKEQVEPLLKRINELERLIKEILKAHVPTLTEAKP